MRTSQWLPTHRTPTLLGYTRRGKPIFSQAGGAGDGEGEGEGEGEGDGNGKQGDGKQGGEGEGEEGDEDDKGKGQSAVDPDDYEALKRRMQAADRRASAAEAKVQEFENKNKSELEQAQSAAEEAQGQVKSLQAENQDLKAQVAFLQQDKHKFINPKAALRLAKDYFADHSDDDGEVDMSAVLKQVAKDYPELLVKDDADEDDDGEGGKGSGQSASGSPNNGKRQQKGGVDKAALRKKYSALRR